MTDRPWFALGWSIGSLTGWGQFGAHFARTLTDAGYRVHLMAPPDDAGVLAMDRPLLRSLYDPTAHTAVMEKEPGWLCMAIGNQMEKRPGGLPDHVKVAGIIFCEDVGVIDARRLNAYDVIVAGSRWTERVLREKGVERVVLAHQGYDGRVFFPRGDALVAGNVSQNAGKYSTSCNTKAPVRVFSGGKLEFRKGQDIVIEAFKRFRQAPEGKDAVLVFAWDNHWPATMDGIWLSGYVKGVPTVRNGKADFAAWLIANGLPQDSFIDCGRLTPTEAAQVMRSCTVGIFPNRAESGTNLVLVEALASGLPVIAATDHGHDDVLPGLTGLADPNRPLSVPTGCPLYKSLDGWVESDPSIIVEALQSGDTASHGMTGWDWSVRGPAMAEAIIGSQLDAMARDAIAEHRRGETQPVEALCP